MAYIIENNTRLMEVTISREIAGKCLVKYGNGGGFWISKNRVYYDMSDAYQELRKRRPDISPDKIIPNNNLIEIDNNAVCHGL